MCLLALHDCSSLGSDLCNCPAEAFLTHCVFRVCLRKRGIVFPLPWKGRNGSFGDLLDVLRDEPLKDVYLLLHNQPLENIGFLGVTWFSQF